MELINSKYFVWELISVYYKLILPDNSNNNKEFSESDLLVNTETTTVEYDTYYDVNTKNENLVLIFPPR
jgi:hypothetical protein